MVTQSGIGKQSPAIREDLIVRTTNQTGFVALPMVRQGTVAVILRNGRVAEVIGPGRRIMFRMPFQKLELLLIDTKIRNLNIVSQGEFLTGDHWRVNVSLWVSYRVVVPSRIAVDYAEPVHALYSTVKDLLGRVINRQDFQTLSQMGRQVVRQEILSGSPEVEQTLGIALTDVRVDDLTLPERVGSAFDERRVAQMEGESAQWRIRGKWQDLPDSVRQGHLQEKLVDGAMFINPPLPGNLMGGGAPGVPPQPQMPAPPQNALPGGGQVIDVQPPTRQLAGEMWAQLVVISGAKQGVIFPLRSASVTIGRGAGNAIVLQDPSVSTHHARIDQHGGQAALIDLNSSNGTFVNGQRVSQMWLSGGEVLLMGDTHMRFEVL
jgi:hypothetical protein